MLCSGNLSEYCGGPNRLGVYDLNNAIATITTTTVSPTATAAAIKPTISPYTYYGCQTEATGVRALSANTTASDSMTLEMCEEFCYPYSYFGVEYGRECESPHPQEGCQYAHVSSQVIVATGSMLALTLQSTASVLSAALEIHWSSAALAIFSLATSFNEENSTTDLEVWCVPDYC